MRGLRPYGPLGPSTQGISHALRRIREVAALLRLGKTQEAIAEDLGTTRSAVAALMRANGLRSLDKAKRPLTPAQVLAKLKKKRAKKL